MTALGALVYSDWRAAINDTRRVLRSPGRITLWIFYILMLGLFLARRLFRGGGVPDPSDVLVSADYGVCALVVALVFTLAMGRGALGIFRSRVEARFIIGSPVAAPLAIAYLQIREALGQSFRYLLSLAYFFFAVVPRSVSAATVLADFGLVLGVIVASTAIVVPRRLLSPRSSRVFVVAAIPLGLLALAPAVRDAVLQLHPASSVAAWILASVPDWHPGHVLLEPSAASLLAVFALDALAIGTLAAAGRDAYPELYALAIARIEQRERARRRTERSIPLTSPARSFRINAPSGALAFVWKSIVEYRRVAHPATIVAAAALWPVAGWCTARLAQREPHLVAGLTGIAINVLLILRTTAATATLAAELRRPLFWLSPTPLFERLCAVACAQIWRSIVWLELAAAGFALGRGGLIDTLVLAVGLPALVALLAAVGFAGFAVFPSLADQRGPIAVLRLGLSVLLIVPPLVLDGVGTLGLKAPVPSLLAASLLALVEAGALIGVAAARLDGRIDRLAAANP